MKITIREDSTLPDDELVILCKEAGGEALDVLRALKSFKSRLTGVRGGETFLVDSADVLYFESVDKKTFLYTGQAVLETPLRLYEVEERLSGGSFFRASKSAVVNIRKISSLRPEFGGRLELTLENGERMLVSRQYAPTLKQKLGL